MQITTLPVDVQENIFAREQSNKMFSTTQGDVTYVSLFEVFMTEIKVFDLI